MSGSGYLDSLQIPGQDAGSQAQSGILLQLLTRIATALEGPGNPDAVYAFAGPGNLDIGAAYPNLQNGTIVIDQTTPAALNVTLPSAGGPWTVADGAGVAAVDNITVLAPAGKTINGGASKVINTNWGSFKFVLNGTNYIATP